MPYNPVTLCRVLRTGKSTIARTLAHFLEDTEQLGASYFFRRGEQGRNGTALFFPTLASQLIATIPTFKAHLGQSLENPATAEVEKKALKEQFKMLIQDPVSNMSPEKSGVLTRVIVVDALDECECQDDVPVVLSLLSQLQEQKTVRLRVFFTSRSTYPIVGVFEDLANNRTSYRCLALDKEYRNETKDDISAFLKFTFATIKAKAKVAKDPWPEPRELDRLINLATTPSPLFIYAATLCRFVDDKKGRRRPLKQLELWLKQCDSNTSQLDQIYVPILRQVFLGSEEEGKNAEALGSEDQLQLMQVLGSLTLLTSPLPARGLAALLGMAEDDVNHWLRNLHPVLSVPGDPGAPVQILHKSFSDFLLGHEGTGNADFRVDAAEIHAMLVSKCIQRMNSDNGLRKDMCNIREPGKSIDEIDKTIIASQIPPDLEYACVSWVYHLQQCRRHMIDEDKDKAFLQKVSILLQDIETFLGEHFLHWIECLSLLGKLLDAIILIRKLMDLVLVCLRHLYLHQKILIADSRNSVQAISLQDSWKMLRTFSLTTYRPLDELPCESMALLSYFVRNWK